MAARDIQFLVVGAQKAGTSSLHRYLSCHPQVYVPQEKETEFFYRNEQFEKGVLWYLETYFKNAHPGQVCGEICPQYMFDPVVPARISRFFPKIRLIMLLRDPVDRAFSHYLMSCRRARETRPFSTVVEDELAAAQQGSPTRTPDHGYLYFGQYGRIVNDYLRHFSREAILVAFAEELRMCRLQTWRRILEFLGVDATFVPRGLEKDYNVGGVRRCPRVYRYLKDATWLKTMGRRILGDRTYNRLWFWLETEGFVARETNTVPPYQERRLRDYYRADVATLESILDRPVPWNRFTR